MKSFKTLVFFTLQYPYGKKSETFIENEIQYLADAFERVIIIPREKNDDEQRTLPKNVKVNNLLIDSEPVGNHYKYIFSSLKRFMAVAKIYAYSLFKDKDRIHYFNSGYFIYYLAKALKDARLIETHIEKEKLENAVFYDYWFVNSTLSLAYLKSKGSISYLYCRAHGFDVFNERWNCGSVPFRQYILKYINTVFAISDYNKNYIVESINRHKDKVEVSYLGVRQVEDIIRANTEHTIKKPFLIVSCANLFPFKQIERIPEVLSQVALDHQTIKWVHFGDGPKETEVIQAAKQLPETICFEYKGHVANSEVLNFYTENEADLFLSLSLKEGLPVSMMEAQSFGIPIMAYNIFGIPEIVTDKTGVLLNEGASNAEIAKKISQLLKQEILFDKFQIRQFFENRFSAVHNFSAFTQNLIQQNA